MKFWLCKGRETLRNNHRLIHMSCHWSWNNPCQAFSRAPLVCHEAGVALWLPETTWCILGISCCNPLCLHWFLSSTCILLHSPVPCLQRWPSCRRCRYSSWSSSGMINLSPFRSKPSSVVSSSLKSQYLRANVACLCWCSQPCWVSWHTVSGDGVSLCAILQFLNPWLHEGNVV